MPKQFSTEEFALMEAGLAYARKNGVPLSKLAWTFAGLLGRPDGAMHHALAAMADGTFDPLQAMDEDDELELTDENIDKRVGEVVVAEVIAVKTYGALCVVRGTTRTLLLHVSEVADEYIDDMNSFVSVGDTLQAMLIVSQKENRLALSSKRIGSVRRKV